MTSASPPFDLVIFDLDGTLVDSLPDIAWALNTTLAGVGLSSLPLPTVAQLVGDGAGTLIERAVATAPPPAAPSSSPSPPLPPHGALLERFMSVYAGRVCVDSRLYPGVPELLAGLAAVNVAMAVVTNKPGALARELLGTLAIAKYFRAIIGDLDGFPRKPDPAAALTVMNAIGAAPHRTVVVGDGIPDLRLARAIPCNAIAAGWGYVAPPRLQAELPTHFASTPEAAAQLLLSAE